MSTLKSAHEYFHLHHLKHYIASKTGFKVVLWIIVLGLVILEMLAATYIYTSILTQSTLGFKYAI